MVKDYFENGVIFFESIGHRVQHVTQINVSFFTNFWIKSQERPS